MKFDTAVTELKKVLGWRNYPDPTEIPALDPDLTTSDSNRYYQSFHPLLRLDYIRASLRDNVTLDDYLDYAETEAIQWMLGEMIQQKKIANKGNDLVSGDIIYHSVLRGDSTPNSSRFVGFEIYLQDFQAIQLTINRIGLYLTEAQPSLTLYLFNSLQPTVVSTYTFVGANANAFEWLQESITIDAVDGTNNSGAVWYLGYYQDDLDGTAVRYKYLRWDNGYCRTCSAGKLNKQWDSINKYVKFNPFFIPSGNVPVDPNDRFDIDDMQYSFTDNWGFNFNISVKCNLSQFWIDNRISMANAIGYAVAYKILGDMSVSTQESNVMQNIQPKLRIALESASDSKQTPFKEQVDWAIESTNLDMSSTNDEPCIPCQRKGVTWEAM